MTFRAAVVGLLCVAFLCAATPYTDLVMQGSRLVANHLPIGVLGIFLTMILLVNTVFCVLSVKWAFTRSELLVIFIMMLVASSIPSTGYVQVLVSVLAGRSYFAADHTKWDPLFGQYLRHWLVPQDRTAMKWFYEGLPPGQGIPWGTWITPLAAWALFAGLFWAGYFCLSMILRKQWIEHERLTFPLAQVPLDIVADDERPSAITAPFFRNRLMWLGFAVVFLMHASSSLSRWYGVFPNVNMANIDIGSKWTTWPMNAWQGMTISFYPSLIGIGYLISTEVAASLWIFYWLNRLQKLSFAIYGLEVAGQTGGFNSTTFFRGQEVGAFFALAVFLFWGARRQLLETIKGSMHGERDPRDPFPLQWAVVGFLVSVIGVAAWGMAAGMDWWASVLVVMFFYAVAIGLTRLISAGGVMYVECSFMPQDFTNNFLGSQGMGAQNLTPLAISTRVFMFNQEVTWWPYLMNSFKIAHSINLKGTHLLLAVALAMVTSVVLGCYFALRIIYKDGAVAMGTILQEPATWTFDKLTGFIESPLERNPLGIVSTIGGAIAMWVLLVLNRNYLWWRLNPVGYLMGSTGTLGIIWASTFVGWVFSSLTLRYGGLKLYRQFRPLFVGLILGEFMAAAFWLVVDYFLGIKMHTIFP